jgi:hypothetical protein
MANTGRSKAAKKVRASQEEASTKPVSSMFEVRSVALENARSLVTIGVVDRQLPNYAETAERLNGALVKLTPHPSATDQEVENSRQEIVKAGAVAVRVMPRQRSAVITEAARAEAPARESIRQACEALVEQVSSRDKDALRKVVEDVLSKVGA